MADLKAFAEQLVNLTVKEVNELATILKEEYIHYTKMNLIFQLKKIITLYLQKLSNLPFLYDFNCLLLIDYKIDYSARSPRVLRTP